MPNRAHRVTGRLKPKHIQKHEHRHYWPYIPLVMALLLTFASSLLQPLQRHGVLAYATNVSVTGLFDATNKQREANKVGDLQLNKQLTSAAQAKANDMVARNYWSHITPDGQQPWVFVETAGYKYQTAGENLAYGFLNSSDTITGWMNSPSHRENLLNSNYVDVGFGFANSKNFNGDGEETIVVAMYGKPEVLGTSTQATTQTASPKATAPQTPTAAPQNAAQLLSAPSTTKAFTSANPAPQEPATRTIAKAQTITRGVAPWAVFAVGLITGLALMSLMIRHAAALRHVLQGGEHFVLHHPLLDTILITTIFFGTLLLQTAGFIR